MQLADKINNVVLEEDVVSDKIEFETNMVKSMKETVNYGYEPNPEESTFDPVIYQGAQPTCAIRSQEIILRDYGISIPQEELVKYAIENGWYNPDLEKGGTPRDATGNLLDAMGIETQRYDNATIFDIISELRVGHRVIVSVDANELWIKNEPKLYKRLFGEISNRVSDKIDDMLGVQGANHALIVAGVNVNPSDPSDMRVVLIDSGSGDVCIEYKFSAFKKAWDDSHCHMVTTTIPAPFQYNYETHQMEPSNFNTEYMSSMVEMPVGLHNQFLLSESYFEEYGDSEPAYDEIPEVTLGDTIAINASNEDTYKVENTDYEKNYDTSETNDDDGQSFDAPTFEDPIDDADGEDDQPDTSFADESDESDSDDSDY